MNYPHRECVVLMGSNIVGFGGVPNARRVQDGCGEAIPINSSFPPARFLTGKCCVVSPSNACWGFELMAQDAHAATSWPLFRSLASYRLSFLSGDLMAGLTLAAIAIPEQMATARLGGFAPQIGFFAFIAGSLGFPMLGSTPFLSCRAPSPLTPLFSPGVGGSAARRRE